MTTQRTSGGSVTNRLPKTIYRLVDKEGRRHLAIFNNVRDAASWARDRWPGEEQDETRSGKGWDIEVVS